MSLIQFSAVCLGLLLVTHYGVLPWLRRSVRSRPTPESLPRVAWMAVFRYARGVALAGALTSLAVAGLVEVLRWRASPLATVGVVRAALAREHDFKQKLDAAHPFWFGTAAVLLTSALGYYTYRRRLIQCSAALSAAEDAEIGRLVRALNEDPHWWDLPPDADMNRVIARIVELQAELPGLPPHAVPGAEQAIERLERVLFQIDIARRMEVKFDPDAIEDPEPETWRDWAAGLVGSPRVAGATRGGTRLLYRLNALLLVLGLIGFQSAGVDRVIQDRLVALDDLSVRLVNLEGVAQEVTQAEADAKEEAAPEPRIETQTSSTTRVTTWSARVAKKVANVKSKAAQARVARPAYDAEEAAIRRVTDEVEVRAARARAVNDLVEEIRTTAEDLDTHGGTKPGGPNDPAERLSKLRARLDQDSHATEPDRSLKPKADALNDRLARLDPEAELRALDGEAAALQGEASDLKAAVEARPQSLEDRLRSVGQLDGHADEIAALKQRIERLRSDTGGRYARAGEQLQEVRAQVGAERLRRVNDLAPRRTRAAALTAKVEEVGRFEAILPAKADEARTLLSAAEAKANWERVRPAGGASPLSPAPLSPADADAANVVARAYEEGLGESAPLRSAVPEPEAVTSVQYRALATREAILDHAQKVAPTERVRPPSFSEAPGLSDAQRQVARSAESIFRNDVPRTAAGQGMQEQIIREMRRSPQFRESVVAQAPAARARLRLGGGISPRSPPGRRLWGELSLTAFDAAVERVAGPEVADAVGEISRATLQHYETARRYAFMRDLAGGEKGLATALDRLGGGDAQATLPGTGRDYLRKVIARTVPGGDAVRSVAPYEPAIEVPFERGVKLERAGAIVMEQSLHGAPTEAAYRARVFSEALENYSGTFPSQPGMERVTPRGQLLEAISTHEAAAAKGAGFNARVASLEAGKLSEWTAGRRLATAAGLKPGRIELPKTVLPPNALNTSSRARDFLRLHSSPKVGGVLIGRRPEAGSPPAAPFDLTALRWEIGGGDVRLTLVDRDGSERRSRPFRRDLTELALVYAADGRPTVVTIIHSRPLFDRRVLLHPALVDTAAGKAIARTDLIIFHLIEREPWYVNAYLDVLNQVELYRRAWAIRQTVLGALGGLTPERVKAVQWHLDEGALAVRAADRGPAEDRGGEESPLKFLTAATDKEGVIAVLTATLRDPGAIRDPARSPLTVKAAYFDEELVADLLAASGPGRSLDEFDAAIRRAALGELGDLADWLRSRDDRERALVAKIDAFKARIAKPATDRDEYLALELERMQLKSEWEGFDAAAKANEARLEPFLRRWTAPVPVVAHVSGIRERPFSRTLADCFVPEGNEVPPVLDFLIQITYDSPPYFLKGPPPGAEDRAGWEALSSFADDTPWEFPAITGRVREVVRKALADDPSMADDRDAVALLSEFTVLQRLFRLGLAGELGREFPVEALAELHREVAPASPPPPIRTPRWDIRPGKLERDLKEYTDRQLAALAGSSPAAPLRTRLEPGLKAVSALIDEYDARVKERDGALDAAEGAAGGAGSESWEAAWDSFQAWSADWEGRLAKVAADLESAATVQVDANPVEGSLKERAAEITGQIRWKVSAIALRRALDVATDDKLARAGKRGRVAGRSVAATRSDD
jgi:hypothetical protein